MKQGLIFLPLVFSACLPGAVVSQFPDHQVSGKAFYTGVKLDSGTYYNPDSLVPVRIQGLRGISPCLLDTPKLQKLDTAWTIDWNLSGKLSSDCPFPAIAADTTLFLRFPAGTTGVQNIYGYQTTVQGDSTIYTKQVSNQLQLVEGQVQRQILQLSADSAGTWTGLGDFTLEKVKTTQNLRVWLRQRQRNCELDNQIQCPVSFVHESIDRLNISTDTNVIDTLERLDNEYCPSNGLNRCASSARDSILSQGLDSNAQWTRYRPRLLLKTACLRWNKLPTWSQSLRTDGALARFPLQKTQVSVELFQLKNCSAPSEISIWLDSNQIINQ